MENKKTKPFYKSTGVLGSALSIIFGVLTVAESTGHLPPGTVDVATAATASVISGLVGLWGRIFAKKEITVLPAKNGDLRL